MEDNRILRRLARRQHLQDRLEMAIDAEAEMICLSVNPRIPAAERLAAKLALGECRRKVVLLEGLL